MSTLCTVGSTLQMLLNRHGAHFPRWTLRETLPAPSAQESGPGLADRYEWPRDRVAGTKELPSTEQRRNPAAPNTAHCLVHSQHKDKFRSFVLSWRVCQLPGHVAGDHVALQ